MNVRLAFIFLGLALLLAGCQPKGPGLLVEVRAEPKKGYNPPDPDDVGYGMSADDAQPNAHDHNFHLIDYRRLEGIVVWVEPVGAASPPAAPLNATVPIAASTADVLKDVQVASVGGQITLQPPQSKRATGYIVRSESGEVMEVSPGRPAFVASKPGLIEVLTDDSENPVALVYVAPTAWAKQVRGGQRITFAPLPPGTYRVTTWHPILPGSSRIVEVAPEKLSRLTIGVGVNSLPKPN